MDDINEIKARAEGSQAWKLFKATYLEKHPDASFDLDNEPEENLEQKLRDEGYENPAELIKARRDFQAEQNYFATKVEEKKKEPEKTKEKNERHSDPIHRREVTHDAFEEQANEIGQNAADEWDKTKDLSKAKNRQDAFNKAKGAHYDKFVSNNYSVAKFWSGALKKKKIRNEHLENAIEKEATRRQKGAKRPGIKQKVARAAGAAFLAGSMMGAPSPSAPAPQQNNTPSSYSISIQRPSLPNIPMVRPIPRRPSLGGRRVAGRFAKGLGKNLAKKAAKTLEKQAARAAIGAILGAIGAVPLLIILFFVLIIVVVLIPVLFFFNGNSATPTTLPSGVGYWIAAPDKVANGENINYNILFAYDPTASGVPSLDSLSLIDNIPQETSLVSATDPKTCDPTCDESANSVTWKISDFQPASGQSGGNIQFYRFDITLKPDENVAVVNSICLGIEGQSPICPEGSEDIGPSVPPSDGSSPTPIPLPNCSEIDSGLLSQFGITMTGELADCTTKQIAFDTYSELFLSSKYASLFKNAGGTTIKLTPGDCKGKTTGDNFRLGDCSNSTYPYFFVHESGHVIENDDRHNSIEVSFNNALSGLIEKDKDCYDKGFLKTYLLRSGVNSKHESFAEAVALYYLGGRRGIYNESKGWYGQAIPNFKSECPATYSFIKDNVFGGYEYN